MSINTSPNILETFKLRRIITRNIFFNQKGISVSGVAQVAVLKFKMLYNIFKTENVTELVTCKEIYL